MPSEPAKRLLLCQPQTCAECLCFEWGNPHDRRENQCHHADGGHYMGYDSVMDPSTSISPDCPLPEIKEITNA